MNSKPNHHEDLAPFAGLIEELEAPETRPYAPKLADDYKTGLRYKLLQQHDGRRLSKSEMYKLWRFAGTAVAVLILIAAVGLFWMAISNRGTAVGSPQGVSTVPPRPTTEPIILSEGVVARGDNLSVQVGEQLNLTSFVLVQGSNPGPSTITTWDGQEHTYDSKGNYLQLTLNWEVLEPFLHDDYTLFFRLVDDEGTVVQSYNYHSARLPRPLTTWTAGQEYIDVRDLPLGDEVQPGHYTLQMSLYDSRTDVELPIQSQHVEMVAESGTAVRLAEWNFGAEYSATFAETDVVSWSNRPANVIFSNVAQLERYDIEELEDALKLSLHWRALSNQEEQYSVFVHVRDDAGNLVAQTDGGPDNGSQSPSPVVANQRSVFYTFLSMPPDLANGRYDIIVGLYDPETGERLPASATIERMVVDDGSAIKLTDWHWETDGSITNFPDEAAEPIAVIPSEHVSNLDLYQSPGNSSYDLSSEASVEFILFSAADSQIGVVDDVAWITIAWQNTETGESDAAWVPVDIYNRLLDFANNLNQSVESSGAVDNEQLGEDRIWLISVSPEPGTNLYDTNGVPTTFSFEIGYELASAETASILWEMEAVSGGQLPRIVYYSDPWQEIERGVGSITAEITMSSVRPDQLASAIMPNIRLSLSGKKITLPSETLAETQWSLSPAGVDVDTEEDEVWLISASQKERPSANSPIELEITLGYAFESDEEVFIKLSAAHPEWESLSANGRVPIDGLTEPVFLNANENSVTITTTLSSMEARQILSTDEPVLTAEMGFIVEHDDGRGNEIKFLAVETFTDFIIDLNSVEELTYEP